MKSDGNQNDSREMIVAKLMSTMGDLSFQLNGQIVHWTVFKVLMQVEGKLKNAEEWGLSFIVNESDSKTDSHGSPTSCAHQYGGTFRPLQ